MSTWAGIAAATQAATRGGNPCTAGCGWPLDPAAATGNDGTPNAFDQHPGCEPPQPQLRLIEGGKR